jgi:hypothetical protein
MVLTDSFALFPAIGLFVTVIGAMQKHRRQLSISVEMPEPHDFTVRKPTRSSSRRQRPPHPSPRP